MGTKVVTPARFLAAVAAVAFMCGVGSHAWAQEQQEAMEAGQQEASGQPVLGLRVEETPDHQGVRVLRVRPGGPAARAGIQRNDMILSVDNQRVDSPDKLNDLINNKKPGEELSMAISRNGQEQNLTATLASRGDIFRRFEGRRSGLRERAAGREAYPEEEMDQAAPAGPRAWLGLFVEKAADGNGVDVLGVFPSGPADRAGLEAGDTVLSINDKDVNSPKDVVDSVQNLKPGDTAKLTILRDEEKQTLDVKAGDRRRFLREQRRLRQGTVMRGGTRFSGDQDLMMGDQEQRERFEDLGQQVLDELRGLREDVQQLQEELSAQNRFSEQ